MQSDEDGTFAGTTIKIGIVQDLPRIRVNIVDGKCNVTGVTVKLIEMLSERLNFSYEWNCEEAVLGRPDPLDPTKYTGMLGKLIRNDVS